MTMTAHLMKISNKNVGTLITTEAEDEHGTTNYLQVSHFNRDEAKNSTILGVPDEPGIASKILSPIGDANIEVDMIIQNVGRRWQHFLPSRNDLAKAKNSGPNSKQHWRT